MQRKLSMNYWIIGKLQTLSVTSKLCKKNAKIEIM